MIRKIKSQEEIDKKNKRNQRIIVLVMIFLIGFSSLGYAIMSREDNSSDINSVQYGGLEFVNSNDFWTTNINGKVFYFKNLPEDIKNISIEGNYSIQEYSGNVLYFVNLNAKSSTVVYALQDSVLRMQEACIEGTSCTNKDLPIKNCLDNNIIIFKESITNKVFRQEKCVFIEGDLFSGSDRFVYRLLNIA